MCDDPFEVKLAAFEYAARAIPGIEDFPTRNAVNGRTLEDDIVGEIKLNHARRQAEQRDAPAIPQYLKALANGLWMARTSLAPHQRPGLR